MHPTTIDTTSELGAKATERLEAQTLAWLTTVAADGTPQPNPVWFVRDGDAIVIFSKPGQAKLANIARRPRVAFNLEATDDQERITILTGTATVIAASAVGHAVRDRFAARYAEGMVGIGMTRERYEAVYTAAIRFTPERLRGW